MRTFETTVLRAVCLCHSLPTKFAKRLIKTKGVLVNGVFFSDPDKVVEIRDPTPVQVGQITSSIRITSEVIAKLDAA